MLPLSFMVSPAVNSSQGRPCSRKASTKKVAGLDLRNAPASLPLTVIRLMDIINRTRKPLSLSLPGGKKLFLGPGKTGQVTAKALEFAPLKKLLDAGDIVTAGDGSRVGRRSSADGPTPAREFQ